MTTTANIADRFEAMVDLYPDRLAVDDGHRSVTYAEFEARANGCAHWLTASGVEPGDTIGLALHNRLDHIVLLLAAFKIRAVPVNVNCAYTPTEFAAVLNDATPRLVVHEPSLDVALAEAGDFPRTPLDAGLAARFAEASPERDFPPRCGTDPYLIYTGGTTGLPKGVLWHHEDLIAAVLDATDDEVPTARVLPVCPLTHGTAQWTVLSALLHGSAVILDRPCGLDAVAVWNRVEQAAVSRVVIVGDACARPLLDALDAEPERWDLSSLVAITSGGARWSAATRDGLLAHLPHAVMVNSFGASETGGQGTQVTFAGQEPAASIGLLSFVSDGTTTVLDAEDRTVEAGSGIVGRLARRGPVPQGYRNDPERSAAVFPVIDGVRHAIPGDLALVDDDGRIVVLGRDRNVINSGGEKVFAEEVEQRLTSHPAVADAVVVGLSDDRWGEAIHAMVRLRPGADVTSAELIDHCAATLARFKLPRRITITDDIRYTSTGKLDRSWAADTMSRNRQEQQQRKAPAPR